MMFGCVLEHFANLWLVKYAKLMFELECIISEYQSYEASILVSLTRNDVRECIRAFHGPSAHKKMQNLCFVPECTILRHRRCEAPILLRWTHDVWVCFGAFR
jgi:hypothetical protein